VLLGSSPYRAQYGIQQSIRVVTDQLGKVTVTGLRPGQCLAHIISTINYSKAQFNIHEIL